MSVDQCFNAEHFAQQFGGQHFVRCAAGDDAPVVDHIQPIAERRGQVQVMNAGEGADVQALDQLQQLQLVARVEVVGRFVEDQQLRLLGQGAGEDHPLLFSAREGGEGVVFKAQQADGFEGLADQVLVFKRIAVEQALVRCAAHGDHFIHPQAEGVGKLLEHHGNALRAPLRGLLPDVLVFQQHLTVSRFAEPIGAAQQAGLAAAVGPDQPDELTGVHVQAGVTQLELVMTVLVAWWGPGEGGEVE